MSNRRSFLKTVGALGLALLAPVASALGVRPRGRCRLVVNGVCLELPDRLEIRLEVDGRASMTSIAVQVVGGRLEVRNPDGPAFALDADGPGGVDLVGRGCCSCSFTKTWQPGQAVGNAADPDSWWKRSALCVLPAEPAAGAVTALDGNL